MKDINNSSNKTNIKSKIAFFIVSVIALLAIGILVVNISYTNTNSIKIEKSIVTLQKELEKDFKIGASLDDPLVMLNPYGNSPLTALITFNTANEVSPQITIKGKDELTTVVMSAPLATNHLIPVYGLYANQNNEVLIKVGDREKTVNIKTGKLPDDLALPEYVLTPDRDKLTNEFYFFTPSSKGYTVAYDVNGDVRWYLTDNMTWDISRLQNGRLMLSTERSANPPYFTTGLYEIDLLGKVYKEYSLPGGYHHDFFELENGNLLVASNDFDGEEGTVEDYIVELDRDSGKITKTWDLKNVLNMDDGKSENWSAYDWFHNNSVWYDEETNSITLSGRHKDAVINIDYDTGELKWIIGDPTNWDEEYQRFFFKPVGDFEWQWSQHAAMITPENYVFILDNGNNKSKVEENYVPAEESYTRGVIYDIDTAAMTIKQVWQYGKERGHEFYSPYISDVDYLGKDHYIVHSGGIVYVDGKISNSPAGFSKNAEKYSTTVEILDDEVIFEITLPTNMYRTEKMPLYGNSEFALINAKRLGTLGKTKITDERKGIPKGAISPDEEYNSYNITLTNEEDRLVINGTFNKEKEVNVWLYKDFSIKEYFVRVSRRPYTALCIDIFSTEETDTTIEVNKYINKEGLLGKHSIYIEIGDKLYNTGKVVDFDK